MYSTYKCTVQLSTIYQYKIIYLKLRVLNYLNEMKSIFIPKVQYKCTDCGIDATHECRQCGVEHLMEILDGNPDAFPTLQYFCERCLLAAEVLILDLINTVIRYCTLCTLSTVHCVYVY